MKILKTIILYTLFLLAMVLCGMAVMKIFDMVFQLNYENVWSVGCKVGFIAWLFLTVMSVIGKMKKRQ